MKRTTLYVILGTVAIAAVAGVFLLRAGSVAQPEEETRSAFVERGSILVAVSSSGSVEPQTRVGLAFDLPGRVAEVAVKVGDTVEAGEVLARLDTTDLEFAVQQAEIGLRAAQLRLERLQDLLAGGRQIEPHLEEHRGRGDVRAVFRHPPQVGRQRQG